MHHVKEMSIVALGYVLSAITEHLPGMELMHWLITFATTIYALLKCALILKELIESFKYRVLRQVKQQEEVKKNSEERIKQRLDEDATIE